MLGDKSEDRKWIERFLDWIRWGSSKFWCSTIALGAGYLYL